MSRIGDFFRALSRSSENEYDYDSEELRKIDAISEKNIKDLEKRLQVEHVKKADSKPVIERAQKSNPAKDLHSQSVKNQKDEEREL